MEADNRVEMEEKNTSSANESKKVVPLNTWVLISNFKLAYNMLRRPDGTFDRHLAEFLDRRVPPSPLPNPDDSVASFDVLIHRRRPDGLLARVYRHHHHHQSSSSPPAPVIIFFHGGSFAHSSANSAIYDSLCRRLCTLCSAVVVSVDYRRSPEHRYPCAYDDGWDALQWVSSHPLILSGAGAGAIFLAGDSSGGNIAHNVARRAAGSGIAVAGNILLNPMFGGERRTESEKELDARFFVTIRDRDWYWRAFLPEGADRDHPACNPFGAGAGAGDEVRRRRRLPEGFPRSLVVVSGLDLMQEWQMAYVDGLKEEGKEVKLVFRERATVGFYLLPNNDHCREVMEEIRRFVGSNCC